MVWAQYLKTAPYVQAFILMVCGIAYYMAHLPLVSVLEIMVVLQLFAVSGAMWSVRLKRRIEASRPDVPPR